MDATVIKPRPRLHKLFARLFTKKVTFGGFLGFLTKQNRPKEKERVNVNRQKSKKKVI